MNIKTMRTIYILIAFLWLQINVIFAATNFSELPALSNLNLVAITPVVPMVADFNDEAPATESSMINLAPVTPKEADFEEITETDNTSSIRDLGPVTPAVADFEDHV